MYGWITSAHGPIWEFFWENLNSTSGTLRMLRGAMGIGTITVTQPDRSTPNLLGGEQAS
jgi:hypothetical protein